MNKEQFLDELEKLLQDIDSIERDEALNYYRDYFEDAGSEHEQEVIDELGTPEKVAQTIKEGLDINEQENEEVIHHYNERNTRILRGIIFVISFTYFTNNWWCWWFSSSSVWFISFNCMYRYIWYIWIVMCFSCFSCCCY